jgi:Cd2+/Zn2+-exporting ATPase
MDLRPPIARRIIAGYTEQVPVEELGVGDSILVKAGEKISADAVIVDGRNTVDRSTFTGESVPVDCVESDPVLAGSLNLTGPITVRVTKRASDTALAAIIHRVEQAQSGRVPTNSFVQWFGQRYTIGVLVVAALTAIVPLLFFAAVWKPTLYRSLNLLVVGRPAL